MVNIFFIFLRDFCSYFLFFIFVISYQHFILSVNFFGSPCRKSSSSGKLSIHQPVPFCFFGFSHVQITYFYYFSLTDLTNYCSEGFHNAALSCRFHNFILWFTNDCIFYQIIQCKSLKKSYQIHRQKFCFISKIIYDI